MTLPRVALDSRVFFVRCELLDATGAVVADNVYWQSQQRDDVGDPRNDTAFSLKQVSWADMTPLNTMAKVPLDVTRAPHRRNDGRRGVTITPVQPHQDRSRSSSVPRCCPTRDGDEILPIEYSDNYVTVFPGESVELRATLPDSGCRRELGSRRGLQHPADGGARQRRVTLAGAGFGVFDDAVDVGLVDERRTGQRRPPATDHVALVMYSHSESTAR